MDYEPRFCPYINLEPLTNQQLVRLERKVWERIEKRYGPGSWDWPTLWKVYPGFAGLLQMMRGEFLRR